MRCTVSLFISLLIIPNAWAAGGGGHGGDEEKPKEKPETVAPIRESNERVFTPTETQLLMELDQRRIELDRREQALELRERLIDLMEQKLNGRVTELTALKAELEGLLGNLSGKDDKELQQLATMYGAMKPTIAASVMNRLDNMIVLDILKLMPAKRSGKIMESLDPSKARFISELMADRTAPPSVSPTTP